MNTEQSAAPPPGREPIFNIPRVVLGVVGLLVAVHLLRLPLGFERDLDVLSQFAVVPARYAIELGWLDQAAIVQGISAGMSPEDAAQRLAVARFFIDGGGPRWWSMLTYGLLHSGTMHIVTNCLWLSVFGSPLARRVGAAGFLALIGAGVVAGAALHVFMHASDVLPLVGASAGVSAATGAAARFVFSNPLKLDAMANDDLVRAMPALSLVGILQNRQAMIFIILWFATNWLFGAGVVPLGDAEQSIAWEAHVGGFLAGLLLFHWFDRPNHRD